MAVGGCDTGTAGVDTITFANSVVAGGTVSLTQGSTLSITADLVINGPENAPLEINGMGNAGVFYMNSATVSLNNLTISGGFASFGGGINARFSSSVSLSNSTVSGNSANFNGGGINADNSSVSLNNSTTVSGNSASIGSGILATNSSSVSLSNSTVSGNSASSQGGGIYASNSSLSLSNSTVSENSAVNFGGGIVAYNSSSISLSNSTVSGNSATKGGGIVAYNSNSISLINSIVAGNLAPTGAEINDLFGNSTFTTDRNLLGDSSYTNALAFNNFTPGGTDITATSDSTQGTPTALLSILAPLANNGGPTQTHALVAGSPAISGADTATCPSEDQRGEPRDKEGMFFPIVAANKKIAVISLDGECDIGSFEEQ